MLVRQNRQGSPSGTNDAATASAATFQPLRDIPAAAANAENERRQSAEGSVEGSGGSVVAEDVTMRPEAEIAEPSVPDVAGEFIVPVCCCYCCLHLSTPLISFRFDFSVFV